MIIVHLSNLSPALLAKPHKTLSQMGITQQESGPSKIRRPLSRVRASTPAQSQTAILPCRTNTPRLLLLPFILTLYFLTATLTSKDTCSSTITSMSHDTNKTHLPAGDIHWSVNDSTPPFSSTIYSRGRQI